MLIFEVTVNDDPPRRCGFADWAILTTHITAARATSEGEADEIRFHMGGLADTVPEISEHVRFGDLMLKRGDSVTIRIMEGDEPDPPLQRYRNDREVQEEPFTEEEEEELDRAEYERLRKKYGDADN